MNRLRPYVIPAGGARRWGWFHRLVLADCNFNFGGLNSLQTTCFWTGSCKRWSSLVTATRWGSSLVHFIYLSLSIYIYVCVKLWCCVVVVKQFVCVLLLSVFFFFQSVYIRTVNTLSLSLLASYIRPANISVHPNSEHICTSNFSQRCFVHSI